MNYKIKNNKDLENFFNIAKCFAWLPCKNSELTLFLATKCKILKSSIPLIDCSCNFKSYYPARLQKKIFSFECVCSLISIQKIRYYIETDEKFRFIFIRSDLKYEILYKEIPKKFLFKKFFKVKFKIFIHPELVNTTMLNSLLNEMVNNSISNYDKFIKKIYKL